MQKDLVFYVLLIVFSVLIIFIIIIIIKNTLINLTYPRLPDLPLLYCYTPSAYLRIFSAIY